MGREKGGKKVVYTRTQSGDRWKEFYMASPRLPKKRAKRDASFHGKSRKGEGGGRDAEVAKCTRKVCEGDFPATSFEPPST